MGYTNLELAGYKEGKIGGVDMMEFKMVDDCRIEDHQFPRESSGT